MKKTKIITTIIFFVIIILPLVFFDRKTSISSIDNRELAKNPFTQEGSLSDNIEMYIEDRIGFRDKMIKSYTVLNDKMFNKMVHPSYTYGKDGYVFGGGITTGNDFGEFHIVFADMVLDIQNYCEDRNVPFLFVFNPAKPAIYPEKIADGINYDRTWVDLFLNELDKRNIKYVDNTKTMVELRREGIEGFNKKYDANHWNDMGAFYGNNAMLEALSKQNKNIHINNLKEFIALEEIKKYLPVSEFPINEKVPKLKLKRKPDNLNEEYAKELMLNKSYPGFGYYINKLDNVKDTPKALVFQGSYMNKSLNFPINAFREYIHVHDYQNVINFPYYFNIFKPEVVVFEVAEYTLLDMYFNTEKMKEIDYNPNILNMDKNEYENLQFDLDKISIDRGELLTKIKYKTENTYHYVWIKLEDFYDMQKVEDGYEVTVENSKFDKSNEDFELFIQRK